MEKKQALIRLDNIRKSYPAPDGESVIEILKGITLDIQPGTSTAFTGPSGSGKTTLLNIMGFLDPPDSGTILFHDSDPLKYNDRELSRFRNLHVGFVFQQHHLLPQCSVLENILLPTLVFPEQNREIYRKKALKLADAVGLSHRIDHRPGQLSLGECQRVAVARAMVKDPELILADEPTGSLDNRTALTVAKILLDLNRESGATLVIVTHSQELAGMTDKILHLKDGHFAD